VLRSRRGRPHYQNAHNAAIGYWLRWYAFVKAATHAEKAAALEVALYGALSPQSALQKAGVYVLWFSQTQERAHQDKALEYLLKAEGSVQGQESPANMLAQIYAQMGRLYSTSIDMHSTAAIRLTHAEALYQEAQNHDIALSPKALHYYALGQGIFYLLKQEVAEAEGYFSQAIQGISGAEKARLLATVALEYAEKGQLFHDQAMKEMAQATVALALQSPASEGEQHCLSLLECALPAARTLYYECHRAQIDEALPTHWFDSACGAPLHNEL
jgi:hypothetical protein